MIFKGIQAYGFKSFADRLNLTFLGGFTGIVGPNGCGKSNVADAVKWVLGEQAPKALRGNTMQDVIFNGTDKRGSLSYCEVSLIFDNSSRTFNVNYEEVVISRKLYRSGDSEYLINNTVCRLKDITDMLRDTGLGRDGLSIISQGRIEDILKDKPSDRRKVFEEAAGIARLKNKKRESELKLMRHRTNLERINYILVELERQLGPLKRQSEDAKKYLDYTNQLKYHEVNFYLYKHDIANEVKDEINNKIKGINDELNNLKNQLERAQESYSGKMAEIGTFDEQLEILQNEQTRLLVDIEKQTGEGRVLTERINNDKATIKDIDSELQHLSTEIALRKINIIEHETEKIKALSEVNDLRDELNEVNSRYNAIIRELSESESDLEESNEGILTSLDKLTDIKSDITKLITEHESLLKNQQELIKELEACETKKVETLNIKEKYEADIKVISKEIEAQNDKINVKRNEQIRLRSMLNEISKNLLDTGSRKSALDTRYKLLLNIKNSYENYQSAVKRIMQDTLTDNRIKGAVEGVVAELIKVPLEFETAIETALGGALQNIVTKTQEDAAYIIEYLKSNNYGRVTFLPMNSFKSVSLDEEHRAALKEKGVIGVASDLISTDNKYKGVIDGLLGRTVIVKDTDIAIPLSKKYRNGFKIVTLEGEVFSTTGSMTGGRRKNDRAELLSREREIEESKNQLNEATAAYERLVKEQNKIAQSIELMLTEIEDEENKAQKLELSRAALTEKIYALAREYQIESDSGESIKFKLQAINSRIIEINEQRKQIMRLEEQAVSEKTSAGLKIVQSKSDFNKKKLIRDELSDKISLLLVNLKEKENMTKVYQSDILRMQSECDSLNQSLYDLEKKRTEIILKLQQSEGKLNILLHENEDNKEIIAIKKKLESISKSKKLLQEELFELDFTKGELNTKINDTSGRLIREEARLNKIDNDLEVMEQMLWEQYKLNYNLAERQRDREYVPTRAQAEISSIKKSIQDLGIVNVNAIEDYKEVGTRYEDLNNQHTDLTKAEEDLMKIIKDLTNEMVSRFKSEFDKINDNFKMVFKELFGGGRAELILEDDSEDPLEAGITIRAEPPGKKMQSISLLSGGERALIAIAILFAILKSKPMPFCVLDEIEAALDDANVKIFAAYLKKFSKDTQFIVITHRKPTMEVADALYGVTMEEKGVSKMVSVKLSEAIKNAITIKNKEMVS